MNKKMKDILCGIFVVALVVICIVWFLNDDLEHIEDTNGSDDYSLTTITDENIINLDMGALGAESTTKSGITVGNVKISSAVEFSSKKFTGVYEILHNNYIMPSDFVLNLTAFTVESGNFKMVVVHDDKIVATLEPDEFVEYRLENVTGTVSLRIAGESASYCFYMDELDYDEFSHD